MIQIKRERRQRQGEEDPICDCCDSHFQTGYRISGDNVYGPSGRGLRICDECLDGAKKSPIGFLRDGKTLTGESL